MLRKQAVYASRDGNMMFQHDPVGKGGAFQNNAMNQLYSKSTYEAVWKKVMKSKSGDVFWIDSRGKSNII